MLCLPPPSLTSDLSFFHLTTWTKGHRPPISPPAAPRSPTQLSRRPPAAVQETPQQPSCSPPGLPPAAPPRPPEAPHPAPSSPQSPQQPSRITPTALPPDPSSPSLSPQPPSNSPSGALHAFSTRSGLLRYSALRREWLLGSQLLQCETAIARLPNSYTVSLMISPCKIYSAFWVRFSREP